MRLVPHRSRVALLGVAALLATTLAACGGDSDDPVGGGPNAASTNPATATFATVEQLAKQEGALQIYTTVDDSISNPLFKAFTDLYPDIKITHTVLVSGDAESRFSSERTAGAGSADLLIAGDHLLYDAHPDWFAAVNTTNVPNLANLPSDYTHSTFLDFMSGPYVFAYNKNKLTVAPPTTWQDLADPKYKGIGGSLVDPRSSGAFMAGYAFWRKLYGDGFLTALKNQGYIIESSPSESRQKLAAGALAFTTPGVGATLKPLIEAGAPVAYVTPTPGIALTHAAAVNANGRNVFAALLFVNFLLSAKGQEMACAGQYQYLATFASVPNCQKAPDHLTIGDAAAAQKQSAEILNLLGLK